MDSYFLHRDAFFCLLDEGCVFLDARRCDYVAVDRDRLATVSARIHGLNMPSAWAMGRASNTAVPSRLLDELVRRGLLTMSPDDAKVAEPVALIARRALPFTPHGSGASGLRPRETLRFLAALARVRFHLGRRDLLGLLRQIEQAKLTHQVHADRRTAPDVHTLTRHFLCKRIWCYSAENACLKDSLVLAEFLLRCGERPTFAMGVRSRPFSAHAWVQSGDMVLNDSLENVQRYTPIVAV